MMLLLLLLSLLPPPVGRGARRSYPPPAPPSLARVPAVFSRLEDERSVWILLAPPMLALPALPLRRESGEGSGVVSVRILPRFPLGFAPVPVLESTEREVRGIASVLESDVTAPVIWSDRAALAPALLLESILSSVPAPALAIFIASAPMIIETRVSTAHAILQNAPSTALGLGSAPTAPELLRSKAIMQNAMVRAPHRFWGGRRSDLTSVPYAKCFRA